MKNDERQRCDASVGGCRGGARARPRDVVVRGWPAWVLVVAACGPGGDGSLGDGAQGGAAARGAQSVDGTAGGGASAAGGNDTGPGAAGGTGAASDRGAGGSAAGGSGDGGAPGATGGAGAGGGLGEGGSAGEGQSGAAGVEVAGVWAPAPCPGGAVAVGPSHVPAFVANTNYCFAEGVYAGLSIVPPSGSGFYGQGKAVLDGTGVKGSAFSSGLAARITGVTIDGFVIAHYTTVPPSGDPDWPGAIDIAAGDELVITNNEIGPVAATGINLGAEQCCSDEYPHAGSVYGKGVNDSLVAHNTVHDTGDSGIISSAGSNDTFRWNEIYHVDLFPNPSGAEWAVAALGKFANTLSTTVDHNYVHDNAAHGIWFDVYNYDARVTDNHVVKSRTGVFYEISYNATLSGNVLEGNGNNGQQATKGQFGAGIRVSSSGYRADGPGPKGVFITNNTLTGNHEGVVVFNGHGPGWDVNNVVVTGNTLTSTDASADGWSASTEYDSGTKGVEWDANHYTLASSVFSNNSTWAALDWAGWRARGNDAKGTCLLVAGGACP